MQGNAWWVGIAGASLLALASSECGYAQSLPPIIDPGPPVPDIPPSCGASRRDPFGGNFCVGATTVTNTFFDRVVFLPATVTTVQRQQFSTRLLARLEGGTPLFDQTFALPFAEPLVQNGVLAARAAITNAGGPGIIVLGPTLIGRTTSSQTASASSYSLAGFDETVQTTTTIGAQTGPVVAYPGTIFGYASIVAIGDRTSCAAALAPLIAGGRSTVRPTCGAVPEGDIRAVPGGSTNVDNAITTEFRIAEARTDTITETIVETYELTGQVVAVGTIHAAVQSGLYDLAGRLLRRLPEQQRGLWAEPYVMHVRQRDRRDTWGLAGVYAFEAGPDLLLGFAVDHGRVDIDVPGALETGKFELTELGVTAQLRRGLFFATLSGTYGFGSADTTRNIFGSSSASYDLRLAGAALDLGYRLEAGRLRITPMAGVDYVSIHSDGFAETDTLGLIASEHQADRIRASMGLELGTDVGRVSLSASARYVAVLDGEDRNLPVAFAAASGTPLTMQGASEPDTAQLGARARLALAPSATLTIGYDGRFGEGYTQAAAFATIGFRW